MPYQRKRPPLDPCPVETVLSMVAGKWKVRVLYLLSREDLAFGKIRASIGPVSQQVLSNLLRELEMDEVVQRAGVHPVRVSRYKLTPKGQQLVRLLMPVAEWGSELLSKRGVKWQQPATIHDARIRNDVVTSSSSQQRQVS